VKLSDFFLDPILRGPTLGCTLMGIAAGLLGVVAFVQRRALLGEALSHAAYPGVVLAVAFGGYLPPALRATWILALGGLTALAGMGLIQHLISRLRVRADAALCFVLATFFGVGVTLASRVQFSQAAAFREIEGYLYGQAATMTDAAVWLYGCFALLVVASVLLFFKELQISSFDPQFASTVGARSHLTQTVPLLLLTTAIMLGMRTVGVVLMSAMLVAPASAAKQFARRFSSFFALAALFGGLSGFLGNLLAGLIGSGGDSSLALPAGPVSVLVAASFCLFALLFAPKRGLVCRWWRMAHFRYRCFQENVLKAMWRLGPDGDIPLSILAALGGVSRRYLRFVLHRLCQQGWVESFPHLAFRLTPDGKRRASRIVRLHRLWELYLTECVGMGSERVHRSAEEMEHVITAELERRLTELLENPTHDPHAQPIPPGEVTV
jgi:manganese/zinc/iron transport system permease protein